MIACEIDPAEDVRQSSYMISSPLEARKPSELSLSPRVYYWDNVLSSEECAYLIEHSRQAMSASMVMTPSGGSRRDEAFRSSWTRFFVPGNMNPREDEILTRFRRHVGLRDECALPPNIVQYKPGGLFKMHYDYIFPAPENPSPRQRLSTSIIFLNEDYEGGDTAFAKGEFAVRGRTGDALGFLNVLGDGALDPSSLHAGMPITSGEKWVLVQWEKVPVAQPGGR